MSSRSPPHVQSAKMFAPDVFCEQLPQHSILYRLSTCIRTTFRAWSRSVRCNCTVMQHACCCNGGGKFKGGFSIVDGVIGCHKVVSAHVQDQAAAPCFAPASPCSSICSLMNNLSPEMHPQYVQCRGFFGGKDQKLADGQNMAFWTFRLAMMMSDMWTREHRCSTSHWPHRLKLPLLTTYSGARYQHHNTMHGQQSGWPCARRPVTQRQSLHAPEPTTHLGFRLAC